VFAQVYFYDPQAAANHRFLSNDGLDRAVLAELTEYKDRVFCGGLACGRREGPFFFGGATGKFYSY
jgi:hypothetical protein